MYVPYNIEPFKKGYCFTTSNGVFYYAFFTDEQANYFPTLPQLKGKVLSFGFTVLNEKEFDVLPIDKRVGATIVQLIKQVFESDENILLFVIDNADAMHHVRKRLFDIWYSKTALPFIEKFDGIIENVEPATIISTLLIHSKNAYKQTVVYEFYSLINEFNKNQ